MSSEPIRVVAEIVELKTYWVRCPECNVTISERTELWRAEDDANEHDANEHG